MTHTLPMPVHVRPLYASCGQSMCMSTFHADPTELDRFSALEKKCSRLHLLARLSGLWDPPQFLSQHSHWSSALKPSICWRHATSVYWAYKHQHVIGTFNTCSQGPTHWSLTNIGEGYNLGGASLPQITPWPSQLTVLHFPPKGPARSQVINQIIAIGLKGDQALNLASGNLHSTSTVTHHLSIAWANDIPPRSG
jgi:hypothetical protein